MLRVRIANHPLLFRAVPGALAIAASILMAPLAAVAEPSTAGTSTLAAVTEKDPATGRNLVYTVDQGDVVPAALGVTNTGAAAVDGLVAEVRVLDDLDLTGRYGNCWYAVDSNAETAWCEFDVVLDAGAGPTSSGRRPSLGQWLIGAC